MVAEGIENEEQYAVLRACGIDLFKGIYSAGQSVGGI